MKCKAKDSCAPASFTQRAYSAQNRHDVKDRLH